MRTDSAETDLFEGLKIADFSWVGVAPITMRYFADYGATVVRIESVSRPDTLRRAPPYKDGEAGIDRSGFFANFNGGKLGVSLNLKHPKARGVAERFIAWADVVAESFTAGAMERLGLDYQRARQINPRVIYYSSANQGQTGPYRAQPGFGTQLAALAGFTQIAGWPDRDPAGTYGAYTDFINPRYGAAVVAAALEYRRTTGKGLHIDLSQLEGALQFLAPLLLDYTVNGRVAGRQGNRSSRGAPHNAYPCRGDDRWCVITVFTDAQWQGLRQVMGDPSWAAESRFATLLGRKRNEGDLDTLLGQWTASLPPHELMHRLQQAGVPAGVVQSSEELFSDPQLQARQHFALHNHAEIGPHHYDGFAFRLSKTPGAPAGPAPCLGQDTDAVLRGFLGYDDDEIAALVMEGVLE
ncbi:MAG: CoA transferase [Dehalococcoidia bacterium]